MAPNDHEAGKLTGSSLEITDITSAHQLLSYALAGRLERLRKQRGDLSQGKIAEAARLGSNPRSAGAVLSHALKNGPTAEQLLRLDEIIGALAPDTDGIGGLSSLNVRLSAHGHGKGMAPQVPPSWTAKLLRSHPSGELEVLTQASALLSAFTAAERMDQRSVATLRERYGGEIDLLVHRLILISVAPPTSTNYDAQIMLGSLSNYAFELVRDRLERTLRYSPLAFRVWRAISKLVKLRGDGAHATDLRVWVRQLVRASGELRVRSLYPGRSLDLELALVVPAAWSPPDSDWVGEALLSRARDQHATIRERGTAAMGLWQRAVEQGLNLSDTERQLRILIEEFRDPASRPDAAAGLRWIATTLEYVIENKLPACVSGWPDVDEPWYRRVQRAAGELDHFGVPDRFLIGTKNLFLHMILQNAGAYRRQAIETVVTSGMTNPVARALGALLKDEEDEPWLRIRAEQALGFLQRPNHWVEADLTQACLRAYRTLDLPGRPPDQPLPRSLVTEVHTSMFAVGDCFGVAGADDRAKTARERLLPVLTELANPEGEQAWALRRAARAAAYLLTVTAQPREGRQPDMSEVLLERLASHRDEVTARLSRWALSFRFAPDGSIRPLLDAAVLATDDSAPY